MARATAAAAGGPAQARQFAARRILYAVPSLYTPGRTGVRWHSGRSHSLDAPAARGLRPSRSVRWAGSARAQAGFRVAVQDGNSASPLGRDCWPVLGAQARVLGCCYAVYHSPVCASRQPILLSCRLAARHLAPSVGT